jgi:hypothetical protein
MLAGLSVSWAVGGNSAPSFPGPWASPGSGGEKSSSRCLFCRLLSLRFMAYSPLLLVRAFASPFPARPICCSAFWLWSASLASPTPGPTMPSADFCFPATPLGATPRLRVLKQISRGKLSRLPRTAAGSTLHVLDGYGLRGAKAARPTLTPSYPVLVHRLALLLHASFRPRLVAIALALR